MYSAALIPCFFPSRIIFTLTMSYIFIVVSSLCVRKNTVQKSRHRQVSQPSMAERRHSQLSFAPPRTHCFTYSRDVFECFQLFFPSSSRSPAAPRRCGFGFIEPLFYFTFGCCCVVRHSRAPRRHR